MSDTRQNLHPIQDTRPSAPRGQALLTFLAMSFAVAPMWLMFSVMALLEGHFVPRTGWQWLAAMLLGAPALFAVEIAGEWILDWIRRVTGLARVREAVERAIVGEQLSLLRIMYLLGEVFVFAVVIGCACWLGVQLFGLL